MILLHSNHCSVIITQYLSTNCSNISNGWVVVSIWQFSNRKWIVAEQLIFLMRTVCVRLNSGFLYLFLTFLLWIQCRASRKITHFSFTSYPFVCGIDAFECSSKAENHICVPFAVITLMNISISNWYISMFFSVKYSGNLVKRWII